jgi:glycosyltransferase involved in cell wall biosynthesis
MDPITVIIPTRNEVNNLPIVLPSLPNDIPLILVDASQDETPELALRLRPRNTRILRSPLGIAAARNLGAESAAHSGGWLVFSDADISFDKSYFAILAELIATQPQAAGWYGPKLALDNYAPYYRRFSNWLARFARLGIPAVSGSNMVVRAEVFQRGGGFDTELPVNEDTEFGFRLKRMGETLCYHPSLVVYARDHRRLQRGMLRKDMHSLVRCALIYLNIFPGLWRGKDWGYWKKNPDSLEKRSCESQS